MNKFMQGASIAALLALSMPARSQMPALPADIARQIPAGYEVMAIKSSDFNNDGRVDYVVVVNDKRETNRVDHGDPASNRPLLVFMQAEGEKFVLLARNDHVVFAADQGGQCDPFLDGEDGLAAKGAYFTVQNSVACGAHWTDFITFKYSRDLQNFIFHKRIFESMVLNNTADPNADALVAGPRKLTTANRSRPVLLSAYRPKS